MNGVSCLEQPGAAPSNVPLTSDLWQLHQPHRKARRAIDQRLVEVGWKAASNIEISQPSVVPSLEEDYFRGQLNEHTALYTANTLKLFDTDCRTSTLTISRQS